MPSPVGHALGALTVGWVMGGRVEPRTMVARSLVLTGLGLAPDLDLLVGRHSMETHSIGAAVLVGALAALGRWPLAATRPRIFLTAVLAWFTHPFLDALGSDGDAPFGVMMFWPISRDHVLFGAVFDPISRQWWLDGFLAHNLKAAAREVMLLGPPAIVAWFFTTKGRIPRE